MTTRKERALIPKNVAAEILFASNRTCCICTVPGKPIQLHHIDENPANNTIDNLAVLCFDCHNDTMIKGGFGRKLDAAQVSIYKGEWLQRVKNRKSDADKIASIKTVTATNIEQEYVEYKGHDKLDVLVKYLNNILIIHEVQLLIAKTKWDAETTLTMKQGSYDMIDFYEEVLKELATFYPPNHFTSSPSKYFSELVSSRYTWHRLICEPYGAGTGGTIVGVSVAGSVQHDVKNMVSSIATELIYQFELDLLVPSWSDNWNRVEFSSQS